MARLNFLCLIKSDRRANVTLICLNSISTLAIKLNHQHQISLLCLVHSQYLQPLSLSFPPFAPQKNLTLRRDPILPLPHCKQSKQSRICQLHILPSCRLQSYWTRCYNPLISRYLLQDLHRHCHQSHILSPTLRTLHLPPKAKSTQEHSRQLRHSFLVRLISVLERRQKAK